VIRFICDEFLFVVSQMKLNGWQRIGLLISVGWVVAATVYDRDDKALSAWRAVTAEHQSCIDNSAIRSDASDTEFLREWGEVWSICKKQKETQYKKLTEGQWDETAAFALLPVPLGWLIAYVAIWLFRWVKAGFEAGNQK
jgi:hypothetical protein